MNSLGTNLTNKVVVLKAHQVTGTTEELLTRLFRCEIGPGLIPGTAGGVTIRGHFLSNGVYGQQQASIDGADDIERLATLREIEVAL